MTRKLFYIIGAAIFGASLGSCSGNLMMHAKCEPLMMQSVLQYRLIFNVPASQKRRFVTKLNEYLFRNGYDFETSEDTNYLSPPDRSGVMTRFTNVKTIGCTYRSIIWSENVVRENQFIVTVHRAILGSREDAARTALELRLLASLDRPGLITVNMQKMGRDTD